jgi:hypothetical protein
VEFGFLAAPARALGPFEMRKNATNARGAFPAGRKQMRRPAVPDAA